MGGEVVDPRDFTEITDAEPGSRLKCGMGRYRPGSRRKTKKSGIESVPTNLSKGMRQPT